MCCTRPLPKDFSPTIIPLSKSWIVPATISLAEADFLLINTTKGISKSKIGLLLDFHVLFDLRVFLGPA